MKTHCEWTFRFGCCVMAVITTAACSASSGGNTVSLRRDAAATDGSAETGIAPQPGGQSGRDARGVEESSDGGVVADGYASSATKPDASALPDGDTAKGDGSAQGGGGMDGTADDVSATDAAGIDASTATPDAADPGLGDAATTDNCVARIRSQGYVFAPAPGCSECKDNALSQEGKCKSMVDCLAQKWPCSANCWTDCLNQVGGSGVVDECVSRLTNASCGNH